MGLCKIILDRLGDLSPGDTVYGTVLCSFGGEEKVRGIECTFEGHEKTQFAKKSGKRTTWYRGNHCLFKTSLILHGEGTMQSGQIEFPFSFTLPSIVPNSYQDKYASIRYFLTAVVDRPFAFDYQDEVTLNVVAPIDLNLLRQQISMEPIAFEREKVLCCLCCISAPIQFKLILEKNAFIVGETAILRIEINNLSSTNIRGIKIKLKKFMKYHCDSGRRTHEMNYPITKTRASGVGAHGRRVYIIDFLIPPTTVVTNFALCTMIKEWYMLTAEAVIPGFHTNLKLSTKITLGHQPISDNTRPTAPLPTPGSPGDPPSYADVTSQEDSALLKPSAPSI